MRKQTYTTITSRHLDLSGLGQEERDFLGAARERFEKDSEWSSFAAWWTKEFREKGFARSSSVYRVCQDLEARLGIAQGMVAPPGYRDYIASLIDERYGSRYHFCNETGLDPGHLSRVLSSKSDLSLQSLQTVLDALNASLVIEPNEELAKRSKLQRGVRSFAAANR